MNENSALPSVIGLKYFKQLRALVKRLESHHNHTNRTLHFDDYTAFLLLAFLQPVNGTLRWIQRASRLKAVQKRLGVESTSIASLSDASRVFDPELLRQIFLELAATASAADGPARPAGVPANLTLIAADATLWKTLPKMCRELFDAPLTRAKKGTLQGHLQFDVLRQIPCEAAFSLKDGGDRQALREKLAPHTLYLLDRGYLDYSLYQDIQNAGSSFIARLKESCVWRVTERATLKPEASAAGVVEDLRIELGAETGGAGLRLIRLRTTLPAPHNLHPVRKNGKHKAYAKGEPREVELLLVTDRMDLSPEVIAHLYRCRWQVELFFRWFKCVLGCRRLMAHTENGLNLQMYAALIASLLVVVWTGRKPTTAILDMLHFHLMGWASSDELDAALKAKPPKTT